MDCYEARLESFHKTRRVKTKTGTVILKWPHPDTYLATPEQLAEAGFYYSPTVEARDSVKCFMCRKELDEWDEDDDPISVHFARCRDICAWAVARCGNVEDLDANGGYVWDNLNHGQASHIAYQVYLQRSITSTHEQDHGESQTRNVCLQLAPRSYTRTRRQLEEGMLHTHLLESYSSHSERWRKQVFSMLPILPETTPQYVSTVLLH